MAATHVDFSQLPDEILELILNRLRHPKDFLSFGAVCSSWCFVSSAALPKRLAPMLLLPPDHDDDNGVHRLFEFSQNKAFPIHLPEIAGKWSFSHHNGYPLPVPEITGKWCCHAWNGWLATLACFPPHKMEFFHPITRARVQLPPAETFQDPPPDVEETAIQVFIKKLIPSSDPLDDPDCVFLAIHGLRFKLAFCRAKDNCWKTLEGHPIHYNDIIYFKNQFLAVGPFGVFQCDIGPDQKVRPFAPPVVHGCFDRKYLVELSGELLLVVRRLDWDYPDPNHPDLYRHMTPNFDVYKLDLTNLVWNELDNLGDNNALFVGHNQALLLSTKEFAEFKSDCIYFVDDYTEGYDTDSYGCHDMGIFNVKTRAFEPLLPFTQFWYPQLFWISLSVSYSFS